MTMTMDYTFDATRYQPDTGFTPVPEGTYSVKVSNTEITAIKDNKGHMFVVEFTVTDGQYAGSKFFNRYNLWHTENQQTADIAHRQLTALCYVTGIFAVDMRTAGANLRGALLRVRVNNDGQYNNVKEVFDTAGNKPGASPANNQTSPAAAPVQGSVPVAAATPQNWPSSATSVAQPAFPAAAPAPTAAPAPATEQWTQQAAPAAAPWGAPQQ